jgi:hypothetical protein
LAGGGQSPAISQHAIITIPNLLTGYRFVAAPVLLQGAAPIPSLYELGKDILTVSAITTLWIGGGLFLPVPENFPGNQALKQGFFRA